MSLILDRKHSYYDASDLANELTFEFEIQIFFDKDNSLIWHIYVHIDELGETLYRKFKNLECRSVLVLMLRYVQRTLAPRYANIEVLKHTIDSILNRDLAPLDLLSAKDIQEIIKTSDLNEEQIKRFKSKLR